MQSFQARGAGFCPYGERCSVKPQTYQIPYPELDGGAFDCVLACKFAVGLQEQGRDPESCKLLGSSGPGDADAGVAASKLECVYTHACL